jgi:hypothetical protein
MTRTVSVELTEDELKLAYCIRSDEYGQFSETAKSLDNKFYTAMQQFARDADHEEKVQALDNATYHTAIPDGNRPVPTVILKHLNAAGWDLIRMEKK